MKAEIISIGDELLIGQVINTNASWMATLLNQSGISVVRITTISDEEQDILHALEDAGHRAEIVLITGGLGPTNDDITKEVLARYFKGKLVLHQPSLAQIEQLFKARNIPMTEVNKRQAEIPDNCEPIPNSNGTAPGMWFEKEASVYVSMPGVPFEMKAMMQDFILPKLLKKFRAGNIIHKTILTHGVGESYLAEIISDWENSLPTHIKLAYLPQPGIVRLRISATGEDRKALINEVNHYSNELHRQIPRLIFGYDDTSMEEVVGKLLMENGHTLSTAESCTGGYIAHMITSVAGSSAYYKGSVVSYANVVKESLLGVPAHLLEDFGAVSQQVVEAMALGAKARINTDFALATSGIAGPDGGTPEKPVGTIWIAVAGPEGLTSKLLTLGEHRGRNIRRTALAALNMLRLVLTNKD